MTTKLYENLFLVNNIPQIEGILQVRDMIKGYAFMDIINMMNDMKDAEKHAEKFKYVNMAIWQAFSRRRPVDEDRDMYHQNWVFGFDEARYGHDQEKWYTLCNIVDYDEPERDMKFYTEKIKIMSGNCYVCGEYIPYYAEHYYEYNIPYCFCNHNDHLYMDVDSDDEEEEEEEQQHSHEEYEEEYRKYFEEDEDDEDAKYEKGLDYLIDKHNR